MNTKETIEILNVIAGAQQSCASVKLSIGTTTKSGQVVSGGVYIEDCPAIVINKLHESGWSLSMNDGLLTPSFKISQEETRNDLLYPLK